MKTLILLALCIVSTTVLAQKDLRFAVDKITGDTLWTTGLEKLYSKASFSGTVGEQLRVAAGKTKVGVLISFSVQTGKTSLFGIDKESKAMLRLEDGTIVTLEARNDALSSNEGFSYGSSGMAHFTPTSDDIGHLIKSPVKVIRIESSNGNMDYELKGKFSTVIMDQLDRIEKLK